MVARQAVGRPVRGDAAVLQPVQAPSGGGDPDRAVAPLAQGPHVVAREAFAGRVGQEQAVAQPVQAADPGADPEAPLLVARERPDVSVREPLARPDRVERPVRQPPDAVPPGPVPDRPGRVHVHGRRLVGEEAVLLAKRPRPAVPRPREARAGRRDPDAAFRVGSEASHEAGAELPGSEDPDDAPVPDDGDPLAARTDPEVSVPLERQRADLVERESLPKAHLLHGAAAGDPLDAAAAADPRVSGRVEDDRPDDRGGQPLGRAERREGPVPMPTEDPAAVRARPEAPVGPLGQADDRVVLQLRRVAPVPGREARPVEPDEPLLRPQPEVAVPSAEDHLHGVLRKPLCLLPDVQAVLRQPLPRFEGQPGPAGDEPERQGADGHRPPEHVPIIGALPRKDEAAPARAFRRRLTGGGPFLIFGA